MSKTLNVFAKIALVVLVFVVFATACGQPPTPAAPTLAEATTAATKGAIPPTAVPTEAKPVDIELWVDPSVSEQGPPPADWIAYKVIREKLNINLKLVLVQKGADAEAKLNAAAAANTLPDVLQLLTASGDNRQMLIRYQKLGLLAPVDSLLPLMPTRVKTHYDDPVRMKLGQVGGVQYGLMEPPPIPRRAGVVVRKDWLDKLGLKPPTTLDQIFDVAKAFTEKDPDGNGRADTYGIGGFVIGNGLGDRFEYVLGAYGLPGIWDLRDPSTIKLNARDPNYPKALAFFNKLVTAKVIDPDWPTLKADDFRAKWKQGRYGLMWEDFCALSCQSNYTAFDKNFPDGEWLPLPVPTGPDGKASAGVESGRGIIITVSKKAADAGKGPAIARLLEWMANPEGYYLLGWGEEGKQYKLDKDGNISFEGLDPKLVWTAPEAQVYSQLRNTLIFINTSQEMKARYPTWKAQAGKMMDPFYYLKFDQAQPWVDGTPLQVVNPHPKAADFSRYYNENIIQFALGQKPLNDQTWAEFLKGLDGLGAKEWEASAKKDLTDAGFLK